MNFFFIDLFVSRNEKGDLFLEDTKNLLGFFSFFFNFFFFILFILKFLEIYDT